MGYTVQEKGKIAKDLLQQPEKRVNFFNKKGEYADFTEDDLIEGLHYNNNGSNEEWTDKGDTAFTVRRNILEIYVSKTKDKFNLIKNAFEKKYRGLYKKGPVNFFFSDYTIDEYVDDNTLSSASDFIEEIVRFNVNNKDSKNLPYEVAKYLFIEKDKGYPITEYIETAFKTVLNKDISEYLLYERGKPAYKLLGGEDEIYNQPTEESGSETPDKPTEESGSETPDKPTEKKTTNDSEEGTLDDTNNENKSVETQTMITDTNTGSSDGQDATDTEEIKLSKNTSFLDIDKYWNFYNVMSPSVIIEFRNTNGGWTNISSDNNNYFVSLNISDFGSKELDLVLFDRNFTDIQTVIAQALKSTQSDVMQMNSYKESERKKANGEEVLEGEVEVDVENSDANLTINYFDTEMSNLRIRYGYSEENKPINLGSGYTGFSGNVTSGNRSRWRSLTNNSNPYTDKNRDKISDDELKEALNSKNPEEKIMNIADDRNFMELNQQATIMSTQTEFFITGLSTTLTETGIKYNIKAVSLETMKLNGYKILQRYSVLRGKPYDLLNSFEKGFSKFLKIEYDSDVSTRINGEALQFDYISGEYKVLGEKEVADNIEELLRPLASMKEYINILLDLKKCVQMSPNTIAENVQGSGIGDIFYDNLKDIDFNKSLSKSTITIPSLSPMGLLVRLTKKKSSEFEDLSNIPKLVDLAGKLSYSAKDLIMYSNIKGYPFASYEEDNISPSIYIKLLMLLTLTRSFKVNYKQSSFAFLLENLSRFENNTKKVINKIKRLNEFNKSLPVHWTCDIPEDLNLISPENLLSDDNYIPNGNNGPWSKNTHYYYYFGINNNYYGKAEEEYLKYKQKSNDGKYIINISTKYTQIEVMGNERTLIPNQINFFQYSDKSLKYIDLLRNLENLVGFQDDFPYTYNSLEALKEASYNYHKFVDQRIPVHQYKYFRYCYKNEENGKYYYGSYPISLERFYVKGTIGNDSDFLFDYMQNFFNYFSGAISEGESDLARDMNEFMTLFNEYIFKTGDKNTIEYLKEGGKDLSEVGMYFEGTSVRNDFVGESIYKNMQDLYDSFTDEGQVVEIRNVTLEGNKGRTKKDISSYINIPLGDNIHAYIGSNAYDIFNYNLLASCDTITGKGTVHKEMLRKLIEIIYNLFSMIQWVNKYDYDETTEEKENRLLKLFTVSNLSVEEGEDKSSYTVEKKEVGSNSAVGGGSTYGGSIGYILTKFNVKINFDVTMQKVLSKKEHFINEGDCSYNGQDYETTLELIKEYNNAYGNLLGKSILEENLDKKVDEWEKDPISGKNIGTTYRKFYKEYGKGEYDSLVNGKFMVKFDYTDIQVGGLKNDMKNIIQNDLLPFVKDYQKNNDKGAREILNGYDPSTSFADFVVDKEIKDYESGESKKAEVKKFNNGSYEEEFGVFPTSKLNIYKDLQEKTDISKSAFSLSFSDKGNLMNNLWQSISLTSNSGAHSKKFTKLYVDKAVAGIDEKINLLQSEAKKKYDAIDQFKQLNIGKEIEIPLGGKDAMDTSKSYWKSLSSLFDEFCSKCPSLISSEEKALLQVKANKGDKVDATKGTVTYINEKGEESTTNLLEEYPRYNLTWGIGDKESNEERTIIKFFWKKPTKPSKVRMYNWGVGNGSHHCVKNVSIATGNELALLHQATTFTFDSNGKSTMTTTSKSGTDVSKQSSSGKTENETKLEDYATLATNVALCTTDNNIINGMKNTVSKGTISLLGDPSIKFYGKFQPYTYPIYLNIKLPGRRMVNEAFFNNGESGIDSPNGAPLTYQLSGFYTICKINHSISSSGYTTDLEVMKYPGSDGGALL